MLYDQRQCRLGEFVVNRSNRKSIFVEYLSIQLQNRLRKEFFCQAAIIALARQD